MTISTIIYLSEVLSKLSDQLFVLSIIWLIFVSVLGFMSLMIFYDGYASDGEEQYFCIVKKIFKTVPAVFLIFFATAFMPTKSTMYMMAASKYLSESDVPEQVKEIIGLELKHYIKKLKEEE